MKLYRKKQLIEVIEFLDNGDVKVQNQGNNEDQWIIPGDVFKATYEEVKEDLDDKKFKKKKT